MIKGMFQINILILIILIIVTSSLSLNNNNPIVDKKMKIIGFGSPIVDGVIHHDSDPSLSEKMKQQFSYHMNENFPIEFYYQVLESTKPYLLGGSAMNAMRAANYMLNLADSQSFANKTGFIGSIGNDEYGRFIKDGLNKDGVIFYYEEIKSERTATNIVLIENLERTLYTDLGVSDKISLDHFFKITEDLLNTQIFYADAYLIGKRFDCFKYVFKNTSFANSTTLILNTASDNIVKDYFDNIIEIAPFIDVFIINKDELRMLKRKFGIEEHKMNTFEFIEYFSKQIDKINKNKKRIIVNTRGIQDTIVYSVDYIKNKTEMDLIPVDDFDRSLIQDLNGAGDAFAGGFIAGLVLNLEIKECAILGIELAGEIIKLKGFQIPKLNREFFSLNFKKIDHDTKNDDL